MRSNLGHIAIATIFAFFVATGAYAQAVFTDITEDAGVALTDWRL